MNAEEPLINYTELARKHGLGRSEVKEMFYHFLYSSGEESLAAHMSKRYPNITFTQITNLLKDFNEVQVRV